MVKIRMGGHGQCKFVRSQPEPLHVREDHLFWCLGDARINQHGVLACEQILKQVTFAKQRLNLVYPVIEFPGVLLFSK
jgi:hypothetical protein